MDSNSMGIETKDRLPEPGISVLVFVQLRRLNCLLPATAKEERSSKSGLKS